jgi:hypothetical protein
VAPDRNVVMMHGFAELLERAIPDLMSTHDLPASLAAEIDFLAGRTSKWEVERPGTRSSIRARALALRGDKATACELLSSIELQELEPQDVAATAWAISRVGPADLAAPLLDIIQRERGDFLHAGEIPLGPKATTVGILQATLGRVEPAAGSLAEAVMVGDARAPIWGALARLEQARVALCAEAAGVSLPRCNVGAARLAENAITSARTFFLSGGYQSLLLRVEGLVGPPLSPAGDGSEWLRPAVAHLIPGRQWTVGFGVQPPVPIRRSKGLMALHHLIENRHRVVSALELDRAVNGGDTEAVARLSEGLDIDSASAVGIHAQLIDERVRSRVSKLIHRTISKLEADHRLLAVHLARSVSTGYGCRYRPTSQVEISWNL